MTHLMDPHFQEINGHPKCVCKFEFFRPNGADRCFPMKLLPYMLGKKDKNCTSFINDLRQSYPDFFKSDLNIRPIAKGTKTLNNNSIELIEIPEKTMFDDNDNGNHGDQGESEKGNPNESLNEIPGNVCDSVSKQCSGKQ